MRFFKQVTGQPFVSHLNQFRVAKAQRLLATTDRTIADIGQEVGFCNQSYFGLVFRGMTGLSPREYKAKLASESSESAISPGIQRDPHRMNGFEGIRAS
jgi:YesN/AraC family two-component response regulator